VEGADVDIVIVVVGLMLAGAIVWSTVTVHRGLAAVLKRLDALEIEVGTGQAHDARTNGLPVDPARDRTLRGRVTGIERVTGRLLERVLLPLSRRRRKSKA
jgi:hypothetical protein